MSTATEFILWLLAVLLSSAMIVYFMKYTKTEVKIINEGFTVRTCPQIGGQIQTKPFISSSGDTHCCNGDIVGGRCTGNIVCSLSPGITGSSITTCANLFKVEGLKKCSNYKTGSGNTLKTYSKYYVRDNGETGCATSINNDNSPGVDFCVLNTAISSASTTGTRCNDLMSSSVCIPSISGDLDKFFSNSDGSIKGCSSSDNMITLNNVNTGLKDSTKPYCNIYSDATSRTTKYDSCENYKNRFTQGPGLAIDAARSAGREAARLECSVFNEARYLQINPDVAAAVTRGQVASGKQHYSGAVMTEPDRRVC